MWRAAIIGIALSLGACGDDEKPAADVSLDIDPDMGEVTPDTSPEADATEPDTTPDSEVTPQPLASCVERPDVLLAPPGSTLPCELLPPGLTLTP